MRKRYSRLRNRWDGFWDRFFPTKSEATFIRAMGHLFFWRWGFRHQVHIGAYRADFASPSRRLIIEIESKRKYHSGDIVRDQEYSEYQQRRHQWLSQRRWHILYVWTYEMKRNGKWLPRRELKVLRRRVKAWVRKPD